MPLNKKDIKVIKDLFIVFRADVREDTRAQMQTSLTEFRGDIREDTNELMKKYKSELLTKIDPILKEVKDSREERTAQNHQISKNTDEIVKLKKAVFN